MSDERGQLADLIERLGHLGRADRHAVLARLSAVERRAIEDETARREAGRKRVDRAFAGYSPWLVRAIEQSLANEPAGPASPEVRAAIARAHASTLDEEGAKTPLEKVLDRLFAAGATKRPGGEPC